LPSFFQKAGKSRTAKAVRLVVIPFNYSAAGASTGQVAAQEPQSMQSSLFTSYLPSFSAIASTGHSSAHAPQAMHASEITYAILKHLQT
jgi:hypothetical protein